MIVVQHPVHFQVTQKGVRPRAAPSSPPITCYLLPVTSRRASGTAGMTMIELGIVMGIVSALLALILGLSRHVNETVKIRRAQTELGEWHESLNRWHLQFGEYPYGNPQDDDLQSKTNPSQNLSNILQNAYVELARDTGGVTNITFRSALASNVSHIDPWGQPYIYLCDEGRQSYSLFSCGPDSRTRVHDTGAEANTYDDIYFER